MRNLNKRKLTCVENQSCKKRSRCDVGDKNDNDIILKSENKTRKNIKIKVDKESKEKKGKNINDKEQDDVIFMNDVDGYNTEYFKNLKKGAIIEMTLYNWMVFSGPITLRANKGINLIAAANASGKSSIACALVFGLGYNSNILSRNKELINFIKKGEKKSFIEITLKCDEEKKYICIKRIMNIINNKVESFWFVNNKKENYEKIEKIQKEFNLNLDNLITFMPQENVSKFSRLNPEELFECTLLAIDKKLLDDYNYLKKKIEEKKTGENKIKTYEHEIIEEEKIINDLEKKKSKYENLRMLLSRMKLYRVKKSLLLIEHKKKQVINIKEHIESLIKEKDTHFNTLKYYLSELEKCHKVINNLSIEYSSKKIIIKESLNKYMKLNLTLEDMEKQIIKEEKIMDDTVQNIYENKECIKELENKKKKIKEEIYKLEEFFNEKKDERINKILTIEQNKMNENPSIISKKIKNINTLNDDNQYHNIKEKELQNDLKKISDENKKLLMKKYNLQSEYKSILDKLKKRKNYKNIQEEKFLNSIEFTLRERILNYKKNIKNIVETYNLLNKEYIENLKKKYDQTKLHNINEFNDEIVDELSKQNIIYGPLCKYIKCIKPQYDYILEYFLKKYFNSFLLIQKDNKELLEVLYKKYKLSIITTNDKYSDMNKDSINGNNIINYNDRNNNNNNNNNAIPGYPKFCQVTNEMKKRGVEYFLYELFDSPEVVKNSLINIVPIHISFIVKGDTLKNKSTKEINEFNKFMINEISKQLNEEVRSLFYFCEDNIHRYRISTYDKNIFIENFSHIEKKKCKILFYMNKDVKKDIDNLMERKEICEKELEELQIQFSEFEKMKKEKNDEYNKIILERNEMNIKKKKCTLLKNELIKIDENLDKYMKGENIIEEKKNMILKNINLINKKKIDICDEYLYILKEHSKYDKELFYIYHKLNQWKKYLSIIKNENIENEEKHENLKNTIEIEKNKLNSYIYDINELNGLLKIQKNELSQEEINTLDTIHFNLEQVENKLKECIIQEKIYNNLDSNNNKCEEKYNILLLSIERHKENVQNKIKQIDNLKETISENEKQIHFILPQWSNQINEYIIFLNYNFEKFMNFINPEFYGKIDLIKKNDIYEKCELYIKVKFKKNAPFLLLSISHQSGGERSLTTMLYILSIQKLTKNGFYVLDELNQGLDHINEQKIFQLLSCLSNPIMYKQYFLHNYNYKYIHIDYCSIPQYFILTPQIIKNIVFKDITVHYLFNGFGVVDKQFDNFYENYIS
ncbi:hypothetical protein PFAG_03340 [Plasmodium falciparum Santa Lucia]|uniref:Structural maintenance of chromosomes protein 5 n=4 Tax=Plasmodium falciparum TaxID=5833 RepID=A0A024VR80_PLAFA|nr:hypothetical protein PFFVO_05753 [Plasmodium falciparum Vietnam Oak-Knoll (FVO)]ETW30376.1 hypothetical protein PFFCH_02212 [Plasmodium falciparum FCH/4]ETW42006.1 hypothetical protein PFNF135_03504 [Plasmodium falciparum NF135/5.C10]EUT84249.1 hypothetical protein PFAG_03340 [Plasmodium falciparum Santa Lucia]